VWILVLEVEQRELTHSLMEPLGLGLVVLSLLMLLVALPLGLDIVDVLTRDGNPIPVLWKVTLTVIALAVVSWLCLLIWLLSY